MKHFVAYHNVDLMGQELGAELPFGFYSRKSINYLNKAIGNAVWAFSGKKQNKQKRKDYFLCAVFYPDDVYTLEDEEGNNYNQIEGLEGDNFDPAIKVTDYEWFRKLLKQQSNFSLGINEIKDESVINELNTIYNKTRIIPTFRSPEELFDEEEIKEGKKKSINVNIYERSAKGRNECISHYGLNCIVCCFNFGQIYGDLGRGFIHVHHIIPISKIGDEYILNPIKDLVPVCPNCHAMLHMGDENHEILSIEQLQAVVVNQKKKT